MVENEELFKMFDANGVERDARIIGKVATETDEYVVYGLQLENDQEAVYISKILKGAYGEDQVVDIEDEEEREAVKQFVLSKLDELD